MERCLALLTFLPMDEVRRLGALRDAAINEAKRTLAFTLTEQVHGTEEAQRAQAAAEALFGGGTDMSGMPTVSLVQTQIDESGLRLPDLLVLAGLAKSKSDARRLIADGAVYAGERRVESYAETLPPDALDGEGVILRKGKKSFCRMKRA